jgi:hypothetical protein
VSIGTWQEDNRAAGKKKGKPQEKKRNEKKLAAKGKQD